MFGGDSFSGSFSKWQNNAEGSNKGLNSKDKSPIKRFDVDGDNGLNEKEFTTFESAITEKMASKGITQSTQKLNDLDKDSNGIITSEELKAGRQEKIRDKFHGQMPEIEKPPFLDISASIKIEKISLGIDEVNTSLSKEERRAFVSQALKSGYAKPDISELGFLDLLNSLDSEEA